MKAWMLCLLTATFAIQAEGREKLTLGAEIEVAERAATRAHQRTTGALSQNETISFYQTDWLDLRKRKRRALASAEMEIRLKKDSSKSQSWPSP